MTSNRTFPPVGHYWRVDGVAGFVRSRAPAGGRARPGAWRSRCGWHLCDPARPVCGAHVTATVSARNLAFVSQLGAQQVIDYHAVRFEDNIPKMDVVFDTVGGETLRAILGYTQAWRKDDHDRCRERDYD